MISETYHISRPESISTYQSVYIGAREYILYSIDLSNSTYSSVGSRLAFAMPLPSGYLRPALQRYSICLLNSRDFSTSLGNDHTVGYQVNVISGKAQGTAVLTPKQECLSSERVWQSQATSC